MPSKTIAQLMSDVGGCDLPKDFVRRVRDTEAGKWADVIDQILYDMSTDRVRLAFTTSGGEYEATTVPNEVYVGQIATENKLETKKALREVFHFLESVAFKEALR